MVLLLYTLQYYGLSLGSDIRPLDTLVSGQKADTLPTALSGVWAGSVPVPDDCADNER